MSIRRFHLGLDWGTSTTKLVLRDYSHPERPAYVVSPTGCIDGVRYPSSAALVDGRLRFGAAALKSASNVFSLKASVGEPQFNERVSGAARLTHEDLAVLYLSHATALALKAALGLAARARSEARLGITFGIPTERSWQRAEKAHIYLRMAKLAHAIAVIERKDPDGMMEDDAVALLQSLRDENADDTVGATDFSEWLRPELAAAMLWPLRSPAIEPGLYTCVDVGAWTVNATYFRIRHEHEFGEYVEKGGLSFFGGACSPPSMNKVCEALATSARVGRPEDLWGREDEALRGREHLAAPVLDKMLGTWRTGFKRAYVKEAIEERWRQLRVFTIGGGAFVQAVRKKFAGSPNPDWAPPIAMNVPQTPKDLFELPKAGVNPRQPFQGNGVYMLVAYGLSLRHDEFPAIQLSDEVSDLSRRDIVPHRQSGSATRRCKCGSPAIPGTDRCYSCG